MGFIKKIMQYILITIIVSSVISLIYFSIKKEKDINERCKYIITDSRGYKYYSIDYMVLKNNCLKLVDNNYENVIICGPYVVKQLR